MRWLAHLMRRLGALVRRRALERGLDEEIRFHLDAQTAKNLRAGMSAADARHDALRRFGGAEAIRQRTRDELRPVRLEDTLRDVRLGLRALRRTPRLTAIASLTLALGIGAATAVFTVVHGILLKPLPYPDAASLVAVWHAAPGANIGDVPMATTQFFTYRQHNVVFESLGLWSGGTAIVAGDTQPEELRSLVVTDGVLQALGVRPVLGRAFTRADDTPGAAETVMLTHGYWRRRFGGDARVIGQRLVIDGRPREVIGVMPAGFRSLHPGAELLLPYGFDPARQQLRKPAYQAVARLRPGVTLDRANADLARLVPIWLNAWPAPPGIDPAIFRNARFTPALRPLHRDVVGDVDALLWVLLGTVGVVLAIACANVANLLLVRAEGRHQELALRAALGAGRLRLARALVIESLTLAALGGAVGLGLAYAAVQVIVATAPASLPRLDEMAIDPVVVGFALVVSLVSGLAFGLIPALRHAGPDVANGLRGARTTGAAPARHRTRQALVVAQVALALLLLVASGLMIRTFQALRAVQPGFSDPHAVQLLRLTIPPAHVSDPVQVHRLQEAVRERLAAIPGVADAAFAASAPLEPDHRPIDNMLLADDQPTLEGRVPPTRRFKFVSPGFFRTLGTPLLAGRDFTAADIEADRPVAIVSESLAREMWRQPANALGKRLRANVGNPWREVVGVVADVHDDGVQGRAPAAVYWPTLMRRFWLNDILIQRSVVFAIRSARAGQESLLDDIRGALRGVDANLPLAQTRTLGDLYDRSLARTSFTLVMLALAGATALLLGLVGIYGVMAQAVAQRTREIGVRVALGAPPAGIRRLFVRDAIVLAGLGILCGLAAAVPLSRVMATLLFEASPLDPLTYASVALLLAAGAVLASDLPARRATRIDPGVALRGD